MPWTPAHSATDVRPIIGNLLTYFRANQVDALAWASPSPRTLTPLTFYDSAEVRMKTDFPHFGVVKRRSTTDEGEALGVRYDLTFEFEVQATHSVTTRTAVMTQLRLDVDNYAYAIESMFLNIPKTTLFSGITGAGNVFKSITGLDPVEGSMSDTKSLINMQMTAVLEFRENP
jgi:hypothetical protein